LIHDSTLINLSSPVNVVAMSGLEGVVATDTELSEVDGRAGTLLVRGYPIEEVAGLGSYEAAACLILDGELPGAPRIRAMELALGRGRRLGDLVLERAGDALSLEGMDALRAAAAHLPDTSSAEEISGALATFTAAHVRLRAGLAHADPEPDGSTHAGALLARMRGAPPSKAETRAMAVYLSTVIDHGMNASTFAARVIASTESDRVSAIVGAIGALKGRLHGGAPGPVLDMLDAVGDPSRAAAYVEAELRAGRRIMGMGHRIYRVRDPRADVLERAVVTLAGEFASGARSEPKASEVGWTGFAGPGPDDLPRARLARAVERAAEQALLAKHPDRPIRANVELYTALLLEALGVPREAFTMVFACGRAIGWCAHVAEQQRSGRLIRPEARYVGPRSRTATTSA
jgi:citrate synthase